MLTGPAIAVSVVATFASGDGPEWSNRFHFGDFKESVTALGSLPGKTGAQLFAGGGLTRIGGQPAGFVGAWDGSTWSTLDGGTDGIVRALLAFDDGSGLAMYAGGGFDAAGGAIVNNIARWDGEAWSSLQDGVNGTVWSLAAYDDGTGPALYAGGSFTRIDGEPVFRLARWDGGAWSTVGGAEFSAEVEAMTVFDDGRGPALYVGQSWGRNPERWDGTTWTTLAPLDGRVRALAGFDDGGSPVLYAGGAFTLEGDVRTSLVKWTGTAWEPVPGFDGEVFELLVHDDGSGSALYAGGRFPGPGLRRWDGVAWHDVGGGPNSGVFALATHDEGGEPRLAVGGIFSAAGGAPASKVAAWDGSWWSSIGSDNAGNAIMDYVAVFDLTVAGPDVVGFDAPALCLAGGFRLAGPHRVNCVVGWDGRRWLPLGDGLPLESRTQTVAAFGAPPARHLYVARDDLYRWDGAAWVGGLGAASSTIYVIRELEVGGERSLYAGGQFRSIGGVEASGVARFDGVDWHPLGVGVDDPSFVRVYTLSTFDDGTGPALVAGGRFTTAGGQPASSIAQWDGTAWASLGDGLDNDVHALATFDDGAGPALFVGGAFQTAAGEPARHVARWDGAVWSAVGAGTDDEVWGLGVHDDGRGPALYVGGYFDVAGGVPASLIARYDGATWEALDAGLGGLSVWTIVSFADEIGPALYTGGTTFTAGSIDSGGLARWGCPPCGGDADGNGVVDTADLLAVLRVWGPCPGCPEDLNADGAVNVVDLLWVISGWGECE